MIEVITYDKRPPIEQVELQHNPLRVWIDAKTQLRIPPGTTIEEAEGVLKRWKLAGLSRRNRRRLVAYWFALGERHARGELAHPKWRKKELRANSDRKYLEGIDLKRPRARK